jgi:hypothetical protein
LIFTRVGLDLAGDDVSFELFQVGLDMIGDERL